MGTEHILWQEYFVEILVQFYHLIRSLFATTFVAIDLIKLGFV